MVLVLVELSLLAHQFILMFSEKTKRVVFMGTYEFEGKAKAESYMKSARPIRVVQIVFNELRQFYEIKTSYSFLRFLFSIELTGKKTILIKICPFEKKSTRTRHLSFVRLL
jgi:hypothetical protein